MSCPVLCFVCRVDFGGQRRGGAASLKLREASLARDNLERHYRVEVAVAAGIQPYFMVVFN